MFDKLLLKPARQRDDRKKPSLVEYIGEDERRDRGGNECKRTWDRATMKMGFVCSNQREGEKVKIIRYWDIVAF